ncbi:MAG: DUF2909 family protein [Marinomonas sp.]|jgi:hypothetical protein|uniref:DUF2909 family protein n=1 Tax=unclassified Marinomonas TaxID=196814 RepID=UPI0007AFAC80
MLISLILIVFFGILASLFTGLFFLFNKKNSKHLFVSLSFRVSLTLLLLCLVTFGLYTGDLGNKAPWQVTQEQLDNIDKDK